MSKLKEQMLHRIRATGKSDETYKTYWHWCYQYLLFLKAESGAWQHPSDCGRPEVERWLSSLANGHEWVSKNTQNLALQSVCYLSAIFTARLSSWVDLHAFNRGFCCGSF